MPEGGRQGHCWGLFFVLASQHIIIIMIVFCKFLKFLISRCGAAAMIQWRRRLRLIPRL